MVLQYLHFYFLINLSNVAYRKFEAYILPYFSEYRKIFKLKCNAGNLEREDASLTVMSLFDCNIFLVLLESHIS